MANSISVDNGKAIVNINEFLGLNEQGNTQLMLGEAEIMTNWRLVEQYKPRVVEGYEELNESIAAKDIQGTWYGKLGGTYHFLFACNGYVYRLPSITDFATEDLDNLGPMTDAKTNFFYFDGAVYIQNGYEYKKWIGVGNITTVTGYVPIIRIATPPAGGGTEYELLNSLTGEKRQWFSGDGALKEYFIVEQSVTSIDYVKNRITGTNYTLTTDYTVDLTLGKVTFVTAPADLEDNVEIKWTKGTGNRAEVEKCRDALIYNGENDSRVFIWGDETKPNRRRHSGLADISGTLPVPSAEYFPSTYYYDIGTSEFAITDIIKQYDRQIIYTDGGKAFYSYYDSGPTFPVHPLNDAIGNVAFGQGQLILNNPFSIWNGVYEWVASNVRDERNAVIKSNRVNLSLDSVNLADCITYDYQEKYEYWLFVGKTGWIYNYRLDAWYKFLLNDTPTCFIVIDGVMYFGTDNGQIMKFDENLRSFNGANIKAELHMGFTDAGASNRVKYLEESHISVKAEAHVELNVYWETNRKMPKDTPKSIGYNNLDYDDIDYDDWSYEGNYNPQPFKVKTKAKDWVYFRHIFIVDSDYYTAQILEVTIEPTVGGYSK